MDYQSTGFGHHQDYYQWSGRKDWQIIWPNCPEVLHQEGAQRSRIEALNQLSLSKLNDPFKSECQRHCRIIMLHHWLWADSQISAIHCKLYVFVCWLSIRKIHHHFSHNYSFEIISAVFGVKDIHKFAPVDFWQQFDFVK